MTRLWAAVVVLAAASLGLVFGAMLSAPLFDSTETNETIPDGSGGVYLVATSIVGRGWLWIGVPSAFVFGAVALYTLRRYFAKPSY
jgi:hypothetical protein